jgi:hypothetical protein
MFDSETITEASWAGFAGILGKFLLFMSPVAALVLWLWEMLGGAVGIVAKIETLRGFVRSAGGALEDLSFGQHFGTVNRVFPLSETLTLVSVLIGLRIAATGIRIVKSWIPTVN